MFAKTATPADSKRCDRFRGTAGEELLLEARKNYRGKVVSGPELDVY